MKTVIEGVLAGSLPWGLVGSGAALAVCALIAGLPGLSFAVGIYLPLGTLAPVYLGGIVRKLQKEATAEGDPGVLAASGMIAGEGLAGVAIALLVAGGVKFKEKGFTFISGAPAVILGVVTVIGICALLFRAARAGARSHPNNRA